MAWREAAATGAFIVRDAQSMHICATLRQAPPNVRGGSLGGTCVGGDSVQPLCLVTRGYHRAIGLGIRLGRLLVSLPHRA
jgi:hypothetical protein